jgi:hypothetical protein
MIIVLVVAVVAGTVPVAAEDTADPRVEWHNPFTNEPADQKALTVSDGSIRLNASIYDQSAIDRVEIERIYSDGQTNDRDFRQIENGDSSLHNVTVHAGTYDDTEIHIRVFDEHGYADITYFEVNVEDNQSPTAELETESVAEDSIRLTGTVRDQTQPSQLTVILPNHNNPVVNARGTNDGRQTLGGVDVAQNSFDVDVTFPEPAGDSVTVRATDRADNPREIEVPVPNETTETATPTPTTTATPDATPTPTVTPVPTVSTPAPTPEPTAAPSTDTQTPTPTTTPSAGGAGPLTVIFRLLIIGVGLFAVGGWLSLQ